MSPSDPASPRNLFQAVPPGPQMLTFQVFNAISFQIALGPPLILLCRNWGASPVYIGAITSLVHWLGLTQLFLAPRIEYIGFRKVMLSGWSGRVGVMLFLSVLPFVAGWLAQDTLLILLFAGMFMFNLLRGIASSSWQPWLRWLIPSRWRARYVAAEQLIINLSSAGTFLGCGWVLGQRATNFKFGILLLFGAIAGMISLFFMKKIPAPPPVPGKPATEPMWRWIRRVWHDRPMRRLIRMTMVWVIAISSWGTFTIVFLRDRLHLPDEFILQMSSVTTVGAVVSAWGWGILADRFGSRPIMSLALWVIAGSMLIWLTLAFEIYRPDHSVIVLVYLLNGIGVIGFVVAQARYMLFTAPPQFPVLALTLFTAAQGLSNGLTPLVWGMFLRSFDDWHAVLGRLHVTNFTMFYALSLFFLLCCKLLLPRLPEHEAAETHIVIYHIVNDYPLRALNLLYGLVGRRRPATQPVPQPASGAPAAPTAQPAPSAAAENKR